VGGDPARAGARDEVVAARRRLEERQAAWKALHGGAFRVSVALEETAGALGPTAALRTTDGVLSAIFTVEADSAERAATSGFGIVSKVLEAIGIAEDEARIDVIQVERDLG
jgi:hypothetical protein